MNTPFFQIKLRELIQKTEQEYNLYDYMKWNTTWLVELRHTYLKALLKIQLKHFDRS